ncbi:ribosomal protein L7/L12 [bacterium]|nr:ribosomal protein L7/L12 [bacterium]
MIDMKFLIAAIIIMLVFIARDFLKKRFNFDMDNVDSTKLKMMFASKKGSIAKSTGAKSLVLINAGENKATVMATLRQITGIDYAAAKKLVDSAPSVLMTNISEQEAELNKKALEFVGAKLEIK